MSADIKYEIDESQGIAFQVSSPYRKRVSIRHLRWISMGLIFSILSLALVLSETDEEKRRVGGLFGLPEINPSQIVDLNIDFYSESNEKKRLESKRRSKKSVRKRKVITYPGPGKITRNKNDLIPSGAMGEAVLVSGASNGLLKAKLTKPLHFLGRQYLSAGLVLVGQGSSTEDRLLIQFSKLIFPSGRSESIQAQAVDYGDKIVGIKGSELGGYALKLGASALLNFTSGLAQGLQDHHVQDGVAVRNPSIKNALLGGSANAALELSNEVLSFAQENSPKIEVPKNQKIYVLFQ